MKKYLFLFVFFIILLFLVNKSNGNLNCTNEFGKCEWYSNCLLPFSNQVCTDIYDLMQIKCIDYLKLEPSLNEISQKWLQYVRPCIQNVLNNSLKSSSNGKLDCDFIINTFIDNHLACYTKGPISFCQVPISDRYKIAKEGLNNLKLKYYIPFTEVGIKAEKTCLFPN